jgi:hypothetical protein
MKVLLTFIVIAALMSQLGDCVDSSLQKERLPRTGKAGHSDLKYCLEEMDVGGSTKRCIPQDKPDDCPFGTWAFLKLVFK